MKNLQKGIFLTVLSGLLYGSMGYFGTQIISAGFSVSNMLFWRFLIATIAIVLFMVFKRDNTFMATVQRDPKAIMFIFILGSVFYALSSLFYFLAAKWIGTGLAMVIFFSYPAIVALLMFAIDRKKAAMVTLLSIAVSLLGLGFIATKEHFTFDFYGTVFSVLSATSYAFYVFSSQKTVINFEVRSVTFIVCLGNMVTFFLASLLTNSFMLPTDLITWINIVAIGIFATVLPVLLLLKGLKSISASKASILSVFEPVATLIVGIFFLNEEIALLQFIGVILILSSAIMVQFER